MSERLARFVAAAPQPQRSGLRLLLALGARPRGARLLARLGPLGQLAHAVRAFGFWEAEERSRALGWDADAIAARGRALRAAERRPG